MKYFNALLCWLCAALHLQSQTSMQMCGTDEYSYELYRSHPELQTMMEHNRAYLKDFTAQYIANESSRGSTDSLYIIPVVFHIVHMYGTENVSDAQVLSGLEVLNRNFRKQHPDTGSIPTAFKAIAADCDIEFRLAHKDPNGNCTDGINRIPSLLTKVGDHRVKDLIHWEPSAYLNVYVVKSIANLAGHCLMPDQAAAKPEWDGIVIDDSYLGNIGTSSEQTSVVMAHEAGHYLNLFHIWGGNNVPGYFYQPVGQAGNCAIGDDVTDTPPTTGWSNCNLSAASCGNTIDNVQNAMDYSYCNFMFTQGQRQRMRAALNSPIASRNNLITDANHLATGIDLNSLCRVDFKPDRAITCMLDTVSFKDKSMATPDSWLWNFGDGETSTLQNPTHIYYAAGAYPVTLLATKGADTISSAVQTIYVSDINPVAAYVQPFDSLNNFSDAALLQETDNALLEFEISNANSGYNSARAAWIHTADTTDAYSGRSTLTSSAIQLGGQINPTFSLQYACAQRELNSDDQLEVLISNDCGHTWLSMGKRKGPNLRTNSAADNNPWWTPADSTEWRAYSFTIPAAYCVSNFMFRIEATAFRLNSLYIDNINVNADDYTAIVEPKLPVMSVHPNPAHDQINVITEEPGMLTISDALGRVVIETTTQTGVLNIGCAEWSAGIYVLCFKANNTQVMEKLFVY